MRTPRKLKSWLVRPAVHQGAYVFVDQAMMSLGTFLAGVLVARATSKEEFGVYVLAWSFMSIIMGVHRAMVVLPFTVLSPNLADKERDPYQGSGIVHTVLFGALSMLGLGIWAAWPHSSAEATRAAITDTLPLLALMMLPFLLREYMRSALFARLEFRSGATANVIASMLMVAGISAAYYADVLNVKSAFAVIAATSFVAVVALMHRHPGRRPTCATAWSDLRRSLKLGKWFILNVIAFGIVSQIYPWLLLYIMDAQAVAAFGACLAVAGVLAPLLRGANAFILPKMAHSRNADNGHAGMLRLLRLSLVVLAVPYLAWLIIGGLFAEQIMVFFYSDRYTGYGTLLMLLIVKTMIDSLSTPVTSALQALERPVVTTVSLVIGAVISLVAGYALIKSTGLVGAGIVACIAAGCIAGWKWIALKRIVSK